MAKFYFQMCHVLLAHCITMKFKCLFFIRGSPSLFYSVMALYSGVVHEPLCPTEQELYLIAQDVPVLILEPGVEEGF